MNFLSKTSLGTSERIVLDERKNASLKSRAWAIPYRAVAPIAMALDALIIFSTSILSGVIYHLQTIGSLGQVTQFASFASVVAVLFVALAKNRDLYEISELLSLKSQAREVVFAWTAILLFLTGVAFTMKLADEFSRGATLSFAVSGLTALIAARVFWRLFLADGLSVRKFAGREVLLIEEQPSNLGLLEAFERHGLKLSHHFVLPADRQDLQSRKGVIDQAIQAVRGSNIQEIVVSADLDQWSELKKLISQLRVLPIPVNLVPVGAVADLLKVPSHTIGDTVTIELQRGPRSFLEQVIKRVIDLVIASVALLLLSPLLVLTAIAIKFDSSGPVIFRQRRCGFNGRQFQILKFRTMSVLEDGEVIVQARPNDRRVTFLGNWLRRTSIDELPQLLNVLGGSMSIVGPRPHAIAHDDQFDKLLGNYAYRSHVKPGLTGWAQVNGYRGQTRTLEDIQGRVELDLWYIDNWSLFFDFKIMLMTLIEIVRHENAY